MTEPAFRSASSLVRALRSGSLGSLELLDHYLARIARHNPTLNAIIAMDVEAARRQARAADAARRRVSRKDARPVRSVKPGQREVGAGCHRDQSWREFC